MKPGSPINSVPCLTSKIFLDIIRLLGAQNLSKKFDLGRSPKIGQMRVIPNSKNKYLKKKLGPLITWYHHVTCIPIGSRTGYRLYYMVSSCDRYTCQLQD